jgi:hypothetical protein
MTAAKRDREHLRVDISRSEERSPLFWFLFDNYEWITELSNGRRLPWKKLCIRFEEMGLTGRLGKSAGPLTAKSTWQRVRKEAARIAERAAMAEAERLTKRANNSMRNIPLQPPKGEYGTSLAIRPESALTFVRKEGDVPPSSHNAVAKRMPWEEEGLTEQERANVKRAMEGVLEAMAHKDRWLNPRKK